MPLNAGCGGPKRVGTLPTMDAPLPTLRIALPVPLPQLFDYLPPDGAAPETVVGCRIRVPFGPRELVGLVVEQGSAEPASSLRQALAWLDPAPLLQGELLTSLHWLAAYLHAPLGDVLSLATALWYAFYFIAIL